MQAAVARTGWCCSGPVVSVLCCCGAGRLLRGVTVLCYCGAGRLLRDVTVLCCCGAGRLLRDVAVLCCCGELCRPDTRSATAGRYDTLLLRCQSAAAGRAGTLLLRCRPGAWPATAMPVRLLRGVTALCCRGTGRLLRLRFEAAARARGPHRRCGTKTTSAALSEYLADR